jgi:hypothetical protein
VDELEQSLRDLGAAWNIGVVTEVVSRQRSAPSRSDFPLVSGTPRKEA